MDKKKIEVECRLSKASHSEEVAVNLRESCCGGLEPVGECAVVAANVGRSFPLEGDEMLCVGPDSVTLSVTTPTEGYACGVLPSKLEGVCRAGVGAFWLFTQSGPVILSRHRGSRYALRGGVPGEGRARISAEKGATLSETVALSRLAGDYQRGSGALSSTDMKSIGAAMTAAWRAMQRRGTGAGRFIQPTLTAWRLLDADGRELFRSLPQWTGLPQGMQLTGSHTTAVKSDGGNFCVADDFSLTAESWRPTVETDAEGIDPWWVERCARLEVLTVDEPDFVDETRGCEGRMTLDDSSTARLTLWMPGATLNFDPDTAAMRRAVTDALESFPGSARVVASVTMPFAESCKVTVAVDFGGAKAAEAALPAELMMPNRFSARCALESGTALFLGGITAIGAGSPLPGALALQSAEAASGAQSVLTFADGTVRAVSVQGSALKPLKLPPVIVCPDPAAVKLTLWVGNEAMDFPLERCANGRWSRWIAANPFAPVDWAPDTRTWKSVATTATGRTFPGLLISAPACAPLAPRGADAVSGGEIMALTPAVGASGGWNYARRHLMAWATDGVYAVSAEASLSRLGATLLHRPGVAREDAVAVASECIWAATASGALVRFCGARASEVRFPVKATAVGWNPHAGELWVIADGGVPYVLTESGGVYRREPMRVERFCAGADGRLHLIDGDRRLLNAADELRPENVAVEWSRQVKATLPRSGVAEWRLSAELAELTLRVEAGGGGDAMPVCAHSVSGPVNAPILFRQYSPHRPLLKLTVGGRLTAPALLEGYSLVP